MNRTWAIAGALALLVLPSCQRTNHAPQFERPAGAAVAPAALEEAAPVEPAKSATHIEVVWRDATAPEAQAIGASIQHTKARPCGCFDVKQVRDGPFDYLLRCDNRCGSPGAGHRFFRLARLGSEPEGPFASEEKAIDGLEIAGYYTAAYTAGTLIPAAPPEARPRPSKGEAEELLATLINLRGMLCAEVVSVTPLRARDHYEVECIEYRGGRHRATYVVDASRGAVEKL